ncbi:hypothetical protein TcCL_ESM08269 [Trypanosoma cruzi]|nr:hypothetical protein TcCL_ESM08269 [Trypanosoma cruzi]
MVCSSCAEAGFLCGFDVLHAEVQALQRVVIQSPFLGSRLSFCRVFVPGVGGQSPGTARLPVASRAFMDCFLLRCRLWLCAGALVCSYAGWWSRFRLSPEFTVRAFERGGCRQTVIFLSAPPICRGNSCLWKC